MKKSKKATSIVEAMVVMMIIVSGVTGMYTIYAESTHLSNSTTNKIQAIQIAKQGIEAFTNIRDTNWLLFSSDYTNCWNTLNYSALCIGNNTYTSKIENGGRYSIYKDIDERWIMDEKDTIIAPFNLTNQDYAQNFRVGLKNGIYTQDLVGITEEIRPLFSRELLITYLKEDLSDGDQLDPKMKIKSIVQWIDNTSDLPHKIEIEQILSNWKK